MTAQDTKARLVDATIEVLAGPGTAGLSARTIATAAEVNQALIFYHFGSVTGLVAEATRQSTAAAVNRYRPALQSAATLSELFAVGRRMHAVESDAGSVRVMGQLLAAGQSDPELAHVARECLQLWFAEVGKAVDRVTATSPIRPLLMVDDLAMAVGAAFVGLELFQGIDPEAGIRAMDSIATLGVLFDVLDDLKPIERRLVAAKIKSATRG